MVKKFLGNLVICFGICWLIKTGIEVFLSLPNFNFDTLTPDTGFLLFEMFSYIGVLIALIALIRNLHNRKECYENDKKCGAIIVILTCLCASKSFIILFGCLIDFFASSKSSSGINELNLFDSLFGFLMDLWPIFVGISYTKKKSNEDTASEIENNYEDTFYRKPIISLGLYISIITLFGSAIRVALAISITHSGLFNYIIDIIFVALLTVLVIVFCASYFTGEETEERYQYSTNIMLTMGALILIKTFVVYLLNFSVLPEYYGTSLLMEKVLLVIINGFIKVVLNSFAFFIAVCARNTVHINKQVSFNWCFNYFKRV